MHFIQECKIQIMSMNKEFGITNCPHNLLLSTHYNNPTFLMNNEQNFSVTPAQIYAFVFGPI